MRNGPVHVWGFLKSPCPCRLLPGASGYFQRHPTHTRAIRFNIGSRVSPRGHTGQLRECYLRSARVEVVKRRTDCVKSPAANTTSTSHVAILVDACPYISLYGLFPNPSHPAGCSFRLGHPNITLDQQQRVGHWKLSHRTGRDSAVRTHTCTLLSDDYL